VAYGSHDFVIYGARKSIDVRPVRIAEGSAPGVYRVIDRRGFTKLYAPGLASR
jgi:hypothetical protein